MDTKWIHTFGLPGTLFSVRDMAEREMLRYEWFAKRKDIPEVVIAENKAKYHQATDASVAASERERLLAPVSTAGETWFKEEPEYRQRALLDVRDLVHMDTILSIQSIIGSREYAAFFTSALSPLVTETLRTNHRDIMDRVVWNDKGDPFAWAKDEIGFRKLADFLRGKGYSPATHTEDGRIPAMCARKSMVYPGWVVLADRESILPQPERSSMRKLGVMVTSSLAGLRYPDLKSVFS